MLETLSKVANTALACSNNVHNENEALAYAYFKMQHNFSSAHSAAVAYSEVLYGSNIVHHFDNICINKTVQ